MNCDVCDKSIMDDPIHAFTDVPGNPLQGAFESFTVTAYICSECAKILFTKARQRLSGMNFEHRAEALRHKGQTL